MDKPLEYTGKYQPTSAEIEQQQIYPYLPSEDLVEAVNLAIALHQPLLLEGEPGCGKTKLAKAIAYEFTQKYLKDKTTQWPYYSWKIKSETSLKDGLYTYDAISRLRDTQLIGIDPTHLEKYLDDLEMGQLINRLKDPRIYREWGPLGQALQQQEYRSILLIDEIEQADIDFTKDFLLELDELRFEVKETGELIEAGTQPPIIIITHNSQKPLQDAVWRRCLYFYVEFPDEDRLLEMIQRRFPNVKRDQKKLIEDAIACCFEMREIITESPTGKPPGTRELIEFIAALLQKPLKQARTDLENLCEQIPLLGILLKSKADQEFYQNYE